MFKIKSKYILFALAAGLAFCLLAGIILSSGGSTLAIHNNTDAAISGLRIKYFHSQNDTNLPDIPGKQNYKTKLILPEDFTEGSVVMTYTDKQGEEHEEYLVGYMEKGYKVKVRVTIDSIDDKGVLAIRVNQSQLLWGI